MMSLTLTAFKKCIQIPFSGKYLLYTNTGISVVMSFIGDGIQQKMQIVKKEIPCWNFSRSRAVGLSGFVIGPACHYWYIFLDKWLPGRSFRIVAKKLVVDQLICSPLVIGSFLLITSYLEGKRSKELKNEVLHKGITLYKAEWLIWPPAQTINFYLLPTKYRVLFDNTVSFCFDWYYSYVKYGNHMDHHHSDRTDAQLEADSVCDKEDGSDAFIPNIRHPGSHLPPLYLHNTVIEHNQTSCNKQSGALKEKDTKGEYQ